MSLCSRHPSPSQLPRRTPLQPQRTQSSYSRALRWGDQHPHVTEVMLQEFSPSGPILSIWVYRAPCVLLSSSQKVRAGPAGGASEKADHPAPTPSPLSPSPLPSPPLLSPHPSSLPSLPADTLPPPHLPTPAPWPSAASSLSTHTPTPPPCPSAFPVATGSQTLD